jgi:hypothetical protein
MSESRSDKVMAGYTSLKTKLDELTAKLKTLDHSGAESMRLGFFEAALIKLKKACDKAEKKPSELWAEAKETIDAFTKSYMNTPGSAAQGKNLLEGFELGDLFAADAAPTKARTSPPPLPVGYMVKSVVDIGADAVDVAHPIPVHRASQAMFVHEASSSASSSVVVKQDLPKDIVLLLDDVSGKEELTAELVRSVDNESPEVICMIVSKMIENYIAIIKKFIPEADNESRKEAAKQLSIDLTAIHTILKGSDSMAVKTGAIKMMQAHFTTAAHNSSLDGKDLLKRTATSKIFHPNKVSAVSIFGRWDKEKVPFDSMVRTLDVKLRAGSPKAGTNGQ